MIIALLISIAADIAHAARTGMMEVEEIEELGATQGVLNGIIMAMGAEKHFTPEARKAREATSKPTT